MCLQRGTALPMPGKQSHVFFGAHSHVVYFPGKCHWLLPAKFKHAFVARLLCAQVWKVVCSDMWNATFTCSETARNKQNPSLASLFLNKPSAVKKLSIAVSLRILWNFTASSLSRAHGSITWSIQPHFRMVTLSGFIQIIFLIIRLLSIFWTVSSVEISEGCKF